MALRDYHIVIASALNPMPMATTSALRDSAMAGAVEFSNQVNCAVCEAADSGELTELANLPD